MTISKAKADLQIRVTINKTNYMKRNFPVGVLAGVGLFMALASSCASGGRNELVGEWNIKAYANPFMSSVNLTQVPAGETYTVRFDESGLFTITTDCNTISGQYSASGSDLEFINPAATEMACEHEMVERSIGSTLPSIVSFDLRPDSTLQLKARQGNVLIELTR